LSQQKIETEWLYELFPEKSDQAMLFERETAKKRLDIQIQLSEDDKKKYATYKHDFEDNQDALFITEMNRNKKINEDSGLYVFKTVYDWFKSDLITIFPDQPVTDFEYFYGEDENDFMINTLIDMFDTGISKVKKEEITLNEFREKVPAKIADKIIESVKTKLEDEHSNSAKMSLRTSDAFFNLVFQKNKEPVITTIKLEHGNSFYDFDFNEESDGTRRLFDLLEILISNKSNVVYAIDEMERSLHPKLTYKFLELFFEFLSKKNIQLIFTTHESTIMDQELLRRDEIWFVERNENNATFVYSLDRFKERYDKKLSKAYLDGRYGAIPIFKKFIFKDGGNE
jgi:AAA15 family ATPase/GTPase